MANPTLITGFEDVMTYIRQQDERIKRLEEQVEDWKEACSSYWIENPDQLETWMSAAIHEDDEVYSKYMEPLELREEVKKLQEENEKLAGKAKKAIELHNLVAKMANEDNASLQKQIDELQKENKEYEFESCESVVTSQKVYGQAFAIQAERDKLQKENEQLKEDIQQYKDTLEEHFVHYDNLKEENKKVREKNEQWAEVVNTATAKIQRKYEELEAENEKLEAEIDDAVENHFADLKLRETTHKEWDTLQEELLYYQFYTYTVGLLDDLTKEDVDNFTDSQVQRKTLYERIGYDEESEEEPDQ